MRMKVGQLENVSITGDSALFSLNPEIYSLSAVFSAAYVLCDKAFIMLDGHPQDEILVEIIPKNGFELKKLVEDFNEELINQSVYEAREDVYKDFRKAIMEKLLLPSQYEKYAENVIVDKVVPVTRQKIHKEDGEKIAANKT
jgi:His-Xaa-Ser system protein HxsD